MIRFVMFFALMCAAPAFAQQPPAGLDPQNTVYLETPHGRVVIKLRPDIAPKHAERIKLLAREKYYDNVPFHRVIDGFMAQTGDGQRGDGTGGSKYPDLPAEFYLETVRDVFQEYALARGTLAFRGRIVDPRAIRRTALVTVEGEKDDICALGQTLAAQDLCSSLRPYLRTHYVQPGAGHYGVFSGARWKNGVYPMVRDVIQTMAASI